MRVESEQLVNVLRYDNNGFDCKEYIKNQFTFINCEITDLSSFNQLTEFSNLLEPSLDTIKWTGCYCFLNEHGKEIVTSTGILRSRYRHKKNIARLPSETLIWVRNTSPYFSNGKLAPYFRTTYSNPYGDPRLHRKPFSRFCWVKMKVTKVLERTEIWKESYDSIPEWLTEFYLVEEQLMLLHPPSLTENITEIFSLRNARIIQQKLENVFRL